YYVEPRPVNNGSFEVIKGVVYSNDRLLPEKHFHTLVEIPACEPTCTEDGFAKTMYVCQGEDSCGRYFWDAQGTIGIIPGDFEDNILHAPGHDFQDKTDNGDGTHTLVCARCHEVVTEKHTWTFYDSNYHVCEACDTYEQHVDANNDGKCDACSENITEYCEYNESLKTFELKGIAINSLNVVTAKTREMKQDEGDGWYVVARNVSFSSRITVVGHVNLILCNGVTFYAFGGIGLSKDSSITIYAQTTDTSKMGKIYSDLSATTSFGGCAAIGGGFVNSAKFKCGDITINGGIITVNGGTYSPGIGAGRGFPCGNITISGGIIKSNTIKRRNNTSAIGGSESASCGNITINGGTVTANVGYYGAAIGAGYSGPCGDITINGGNVTASGNTGVADTAKPNAGIGTSSNASCGNITINGGTVKATATSTGGAGIGSCAGGVATGPLDEFRVYRTRCGDITINGGTVTAKGGFRAAGIGTGCINFCGAITINGGTVTATGGDLGPAIGAGQGSVLGTQTKTVDKEGKVSYPRTYADITITGGVVKAQGGRNASAIGTGYRGELGKIIITGGYIEAVAGDMDNAAAIGNCAGGEGSYGTVLNEINISGGYVRANSNWRTPIGRGNPDGLPSNVNVIIDESLTSVLENNWHYVGFNIIEETEPDCVNNGNLRAIENPLESKYYSDFSFVSGKLIGNADKLAKWLATPTAEGGGMKPAKGHSWKDMYDGTHKCSVCEAVENHYDNDFNGCCDGCDAYVGSKIVVSLGAKIKTETSSLRLGATYNGKLLERSEREAVKDMGTIFYPSHLLGDDILDLNNANAVRMSATAIEEFEEDKVFADYETFTFYITIVGIPEGGWNTKIAFRPFIILGDGTVEYGEVMERCYNDVAAVKLK
ncbi:MAG: hypothetical protein KBS44_01770, partial [Clostridiales bacterium]|nr:hypothetical protein [Candidatus Coliplasma equi]